MQIKSVLENVVKKQKLGKKVLTGICRNCGFREFSYLQALFKSLFLSDSLLISFNTASSSSFTKTNLLDIISDGLSAPSIIYSTDDQTKISRENYSVLSIDVGVKNFSYCKMEIEADNPYNKPIEIVEWDKLDVLNWYGDQNLEFNPVNYAALASSIVSRLILGKTARPDLILIERQRFRSMGSSSVLEAVIRSAVLENMIFASLKSLKDYEPNNFQYLVQSSSPLIMTSFWESYKTSTDLRFDKLESASRKKHRIELVSDWILNSKTIKLKGLTKDLLSQFSNGPNNSRRLNKIVNSINGITKSDSETNKSDDLADSLLHGITWLRFEKNKQMFNQTLRENPEFLNEKLLEIETNHIEELNEIWLSNT